MNDLAQNVTFTDCDSNFDTKLYLLNSEGDYIQNQSTNGCDGDNCYDAAYCTTSQRETFTMNDLDEGSYILKLTPWNYGGDWSVTVHCTFTVLKWLGWSPDGALGACEGDCDSDDSCAEGLECYHDGVPPGCTGTTYTSWSDYCYGMLLI